MLLLTARKIIAAVFGGTVSFLGLAMLVLPGPGLLMIVLGLAILATEFVWARLLLRRVKQESARATAAAGRQWERWKPFGRKHAPIRGHAACPLPTSDKASPQS